MTEGSTLKLLVQFTLPLIAGHILQLTYNAVDSIILGRFVGSGELAAVGTSNPLMPLLIMFMQGISLGCAVLIGQLNCLRDQKGIGGNCFCPAAG